MKVKRFLSLLILAMLPLAMMAHAPKKINLKYDSESGKLSVSVVHPVKDVKDHYIEAFIVSVNGEEVKKIEYSEQSTKENEVLEIDLADLKSGDAVAVKAVCNKLGSKTGKLTIK